MAAKKKTEIALKPALAKDEKGIVKWREIISPNNILLNQRAFAQEGIDTESLSDEETLKLKLEAGANYIMISLLGFRELAESRGVKSVTYDGWYHTESAASVICTIEFVPDADSPLGVTYSGVGTCNAAHVLDPFDKFYPTLAENRSFIRAVRNFFRIESLGWEEVNKDEKAPVSNIPQAKSILKERMEEYGFKEWAEVLDFLTNKGVKIESNWQLYETLEKKDTFWILSQFPKKEK